MKKLSEEIEPQEKIEVLFLSILNRVPTPEEMEMCMAELSPAATGPLINDQKIPDHLSKEKKEGLEKNKSKKRSHWLTLIVTANISGSLGL